MILMLQFVRQVDVMVLVKAIAVEAVMVVKEDVEGVKELVEVGVVVG